MRVATIRPQSDRYTASTVTFAFESTFDNKKIPAGVSIRGLAVRFNSGRETFYEIHAVGLSRRKSLKRYGTRTMLHRISTARARSEQFRQVHLRGAAAPGRNGDERACSKRQETGD